MKADRDVDLQQAFWEAAQRQSALHQTLALVDGRAGGVIYSNQGEGSSGAPRFDRQSHRIERIHCAFAAKMHDTLLPDSVSSRLPKKRLFLTS